MTTRRTLIVPTMQSWVDDYLARRAAQGAANQTLQNAKRVLRNLAHWVDQVKRIDPRDLNPILLDEWWYAPEGLNVKGAQYSSNTWVQYRCIIRTFASRHLDRLRLVNDPRGLMEAIDGVQGIRSEKHWLTVSEMDEIMDTVDDPWERIILALLTQHAPRASSVRRLRLRDIDQAGGNINWWNVKKRRPYGLPILPRLQQELRTWLNHYGSQCDLDGDCYVIPQRNRSRRELYRPYRSHGDIGRIVGPYAEPFMPEGARYDGKSHLFRRSAAYAMVEYFGDDPAGLEYASVLLDHATIVQTMVYLNLDLRKMRFRAAMRGRDFMPEPAPEGGVVVPLRSAG